MPANFTDTDTHNSKLHILLIGCGKMGTAMAKGWSQAGLLASLTICDPAELPATLFDISNLTHVKSADKISTDGPQPDCVIMAVKPQMMKAVCKDLKPVISKDSVIISIAAGTPISLFENIFGKNQPVIRSMPNTPAAISKGVTAAMPNTNVRDLHKNKAASLLRVSGILKWVDDEDLFHAITALSGSGPSYVFLLIETMTQAGIAMGLDQDIAEALARQTVIGSAALAEYDADISAAQLRTNVTSPGGTTQAALEVLMDGRFKDLFIDALKTAQKRSIELSES